MTKASIIVLIPHYNNLLALEKSILSINEKIKVDVFVIDDGSINKPNEEYFRNIYKNGDLFFEYLPENKGLSSALNKGINFSLENKYSYVGRLDCGDLCVNNRFSKQLSFLDMNKDVKLLGAWARIIDENGKDLYVLKHPVKHNEIKRKMYLNSMFVHPSVVISTEVFDTVGKYDEKYTRAAQDYALFFKIVKKYKTSNYPEPLLYYEITSNSISSKRRRLQVKHRINIILENFYFGVYPIYGLIRNSILYFVSRNTTTKLKLLLKKNDK